MWKSKFRKRKHLKDHVQGAWVGGDVERTMQRRLSVISIISCDHVAPGRIIYTNSWAACGSRIQELVEEQNKMHIHEVVNHSEAFESSTGVRIDAIQGTNKRFPSSSQMVPEIVDTKTQTFIWRTDKQDKLSNALMTAFRSIEYE